MKVANTRKVNERIVQYMSREQLNSLLGMGLSAPVSVDEIIFEEPDKLLSYAESFRQQMEQKYRRSVCYRCNGYECTE